MSGSRPEAPSLLVVTDAWAPQVNGVVRTMEFTIRELRAMGIRVEVLAPNEFKTVGMPTYREIRLSITRRKTIARRMEALSCDHLHIATEGPLGLHAAAVARRRGIPFTTCYHTRYPEYVAARFPIGVGWLHAWFRRVHNFGDGCFVATETLRKELAARGFRNLKIWSRGVDTELFHPGAAADFPYPDLPRPIFAYVGRVAVEKNIEAFLDLDLPGSKLVVGDGPQLASLRDTYPGVTFSGAKSGRALAALYAGSDLFVFPSKTDTFGLVLLEALACGVPVAAYPIMGPRDVIGDSGTGILMDDLGAAALAALDIPKDQCRDWATRFSWRACAEQFWDHATAPSRQDAPL